MAQLAINGMDFTGRLGRFTAYKMRGSDKIILRTRGGASKKRIRYDDNFVNTRKVNAEFGARSQTCKWINRALIYLKPMADYNFAGSLNALMRHVQLLDTEGKWGERNVVLTKSQAILEGFSLNRNTPFDGIVRCPISCTVSREEGDAKISIPALLPGINLFTNNRHPLYRFTVQLGAVPDLYFSEKQYKPKLNRIKYHTWYKETEWYPSLKGSPAVELNLDIPTPGDDSFTLLLSIGISFGAVAGGGNIEQVKYAGAAKILRSC
jgi:hypothetical protein